MTIWTTFRCDKNSTKDNKKILLHIKSSESNNKFFSNKFLIKTKLKNIKQKWHIEQDSKAQAKWEHSLY